MCHLGSFSYQPRVVRVCPGDLGALGGGLGGGNREWGGCGTKQVPLINGLSHSIQNLAKYKVKEEEHWTRLRRYSLLLQKEDLKK